MAMVPFAIGEALDAAATYGTIAAVAADASGIAASDVVAAGINTYAVGAATTGAVTSAGAAVGTLFSTPDKRLRLDPVFSPGGQNVDVVDAAQYQLMHNKFIGSRNAVRVQKKNLLKGSTSSRYEKASRRF